MNSPKKNIHLLPLGCPKNQVDGELMLGRARAAGHTIVADPNDADVLVVNTCAFIEAAREESIDAILAQARIKSEREGRKLVVTGCLAQRYAEELATELPEIDALVGTGALESFEEALEADGGEIFRGPKHYLPAATAERVVTDASQGWAYVKVSEGCDHECSFCVIPSFRGKHESRPIEDLATECEGLVRAGIVEVNLIAQDLSAYGKDLGESDGLAKLLWRLGRVEGLARVRCFYLYPSTLSDTALEAIHQVPNVVPYIDMPLQHADSDVLRAMRRHKDSEQMHRVLGRVRAHVPGASLRTSFIVGFPGETDEAFAALEDFVADQRFSRIAVFTYSPEEGSPAAELPNPVDPDVAKGRRDRLLALQETITQEHLAACVGSTEDVLVCGLDADEDRWFGRTSLQGPEVDGVVWLEGDLSAVQGTLIEVAITGFDHHDLFGVPVS